MKVLKLTLPDRIQIRSVSIARPGGSWRRPNGDKGVIFVLGRSVIIGGRYFYAVDRLTLNEIVATEARILRILNLPDMIEAWEQRSEDRPSRATWPTFTYTAKINIRRLQKQLPKSGKEGSDDHKIFEALESLDVIASGPNYWKSESILWAEIKKRMRVVLVEMVDEKTKPVPKYYTDSLEAR